MKINVNVWPNNMIKPVMDTPMKKAVFWNMTP